MANVLDRYHVLAVGFENGLIALLNAKSGVLLCNPIRLVSQANNVGKLEVKGLSFDATGKFLGAVNEAGKSAVFEFSYAYGLSKSDSVYYGSHQASLNNAGSSHTSGRDSDGFRIEPGSIHAYQNVHR